MGSMRGAHLRRLHMAVASAVVLTALTAASWRRLGFTVHAPGPAPQDNTRINNRGRIVGGTREAVADEGFRGYRAAGAGVGVAVGADDLAGVVGVVGLSPGAPGRSW